MQNYLSIAQIVVSVLIIIAILLQQRGTALGSAFGGGEGGNVYASRRGLQQKLYIATIAFVVVFIVLALLNLTF
jgi:protein translocase SecG subunit